MHRERPLLYKLLVGQTDLYQISPKTSPCVGVHTPASQERVPIAYVMRPGDWHPLSVLPFRPKSQSLTVSTCRFGQFSPELSWELSGDVPATLSPDPLQSSPGSSLATFRPHCRQILSRALLEALWRRSAHIVARSSPELSWKLSGDVPATLSADPLQSSPGSSLDTFRPHCRQILSRALLGALWGRPGQIADSSLILWHSCCFARAFS